MDTDLGTIVFSVGALFIMVVGILAFIFLLSGNNPSSSLRSAVSLISASSTSTAGRSSSNRGHTRWIEGFRW